MMVHVDLKIKKEKERRVKKKKKESHPSGLGSNGFHCNAENTFFRVLSKVPATSSAPAEH